MRQSKPNLITLFKEGGLKSYPFNISMYRESYMDFFKRAEKYFSIFVVRGLSHYRGKGVFKGSYRFERKKLVKYSRPVKAAVVYNKGSMMSSGGNDWTVINKAGLVRVAGEKDRTHAVFRRFMKRALRVRSRADCQRSMKRLKGDMLVFKPVDGHEGRGIIIAPRHQILSRLRRLKSCDGLMEEYIDTSRGIPGGLAPSYHDLRIFIMDGRIIQSYVRVPKRGSLLANVARGGSLYEVPVNRLPPAAVRMARAIDRHLARFRRRVYTVDIGFEGAKPYIIELNDKPGLPFKGQEPSYDRWHQALLDVFRACARDLKPGLLK